MSRIGKRTLIIPENVNIDVNDNKVTVKGPKGELSLDLVKNIEIKVEGNELTVVKNKEDKFTNAMHGTTNSNIENMIIGVTEGYTKGLEIIGVGYKFTVKDRVLTVSAGYSHLVNIDIPEGIEVKSINNTEIEISGIDKCAVGEFAANVRKVRKPEPYKGKGIRYKDEFIIRKVGKKASK